MKMIPLIVYLIGIPIWMWIEIKYMPYEEGEYSIEFDGAHEITPEIHKDMAICRSILWPLCAAFILVLLPLKLAQNIYEKLEELCGL